MLGIVVGFLEIINIRRAMYVRRVGEVPQCLIGDCFLHTLVLWWLFTGNIEFERGGEGTVIIDIPEQFGRQVFFPNQLKI